MYRFLIAIFLMSSFAAFSQTTEKYNSEYADFYRAEDLFEKDQFGAARKEFRLFIDRLNLENDPFYVKARYYEAVSALELYNNDAIRLLETFNKDYPESIYKQDIYFRVGKYYYAKKRYKDALEWLDKLSVHDVEEGDKEEFYFKTGYANFKEDRFEKARNAFYEIKDGDSDYASAALYYYSHIAYTDENYQLALEGFLKLENHDKFGKVVPFYIAQIYYLQGKYEEVTAYADRLRSDGKTANENDINHLIGDAYYRTGKYAEAIPYLEKYNNATQTSRDDDYQLGYAYYKGGRWQQAIRMFDRVKTIKDSLGQVAYYHIGESFLKLDNKVSARSGFEGAAYIEADPKIQEDALFNYALLSYQLDINPYDEAVEAFELYLNKYPNSERKQDVYQYLVNVYMSTNNYEKALTSIDKIENKDVKLKTAYQIIAFNQGVKNFQTKKYGDAITSFNKIKKYPVDQEVSALGVYWTADAFFYMNKLDEAIAGYKKFLELPTTVLPVLRSECYYNIGYAYLAKGNGPKTIEAFRLYQQSNPPQKKKQAEAYVRIADEYYKIGKKQEDAEDLAIKNYQLAYDLNSGLEDQALYYMAMTYGFKGNEDKKITKLLTLVDEYPNSNYVVNALFEVAQTYNALNSLSKAMTYYERVLTEFPQSDKVIDSKMSIADIYYRQGKVDLSETKYRQIIDEHPGNSEVCELATGALRYIFEAEGHPEKIEGLISEYPCANISSEDLESIYYYPAVNAYEDSTVSDTRRCENAIPLLEKYLNKFPQGQHKYVIMYYLADCHYILENVEKSVEIYRNAIDNGPSMEYTVYGAARVAKYLIESERDEEAIPYLKKMEQISSKFDVLYSAQLDLLRIYFKIENWSEAAKYGTKLIGLSQISDGHRLEAHHKKGLSYFNLNRLNECIAPLTYVVENTTQAMAFEAKFTIAQTYFNKGNLDLSDQHITELMQIKPMNNYWVAKGLILRSKIFIEKNDLFTAEETLKSVIEHYPIQDDGVLEEANALWDELMQLKEVNKNVDDDKSQEIDINGGGNGE